MVFIPPPHNGPLSLVQPPIHMVLVSFKTIIFEYLFIPLINHLFPSANPLWYAHYDNLPAFSDFVSFGGWKTPYAKQVKLLLIKLFLFLLICLFVCSMLVM